MVKKLRDDINLKELECCNCCTKEDLYKYDGDIYCWDCLESKLVIDGKIVSEDITEYWLDGEMIGTNNYIDEVIDTILNNLDVEKVDD